MEKEEQYQLSEVDVLSVGLVQHGAIDEDWFLTKSDGGDIVADEKKDVEVIDTDNEKFWDKVKKVAGEVFASKAVAEEKEAPVAESEEPKAELSVEKEDKGDADMTKDVEKKDAELKTEVKVEASEETQPDFTEQFAEMQKTVQEMADAKHEATIKSLQDKVITLEKKNADTEESTERAELVERARDFRALPGKYPEMGKRFYTLKKSLEKDDFEWWIALLKATDEQLFVAGIFNERGTTLTPDNIKVEEKLLKQAEEDDIPIDEAMLKLSREDQESMLEVSRQEVK